MQEMRGSRKICKIQHKYISWDITIGSRKSLRRVYNYKPWQTQALQFWGLQVLQLFARTNLLVRKRRFNLVGLPSLYHCIERRMYQALPVDSSSPADRWKPPSWMLVRSTVRVVECTWTKWTKVQACSLQKLKSLQQHVQDGWVLLLSHLTKRLCSSCLQHQDGKFAIHDASARDLSLPKVSFLRLSALWVKIFAEITAIAKVRNKREREREREREIVVYSTNHRFPVIRTFLHSSGYDIQEKFAEQSFRWMVSGSKSEHTVSQVSQALLCKTAINRTHASVSSCRMFKMAKAVYR